MDRSHSEGLRKFEPFIQSTGYIVSYSADSIKVEFNTLSNQRARWHSAVKLI